MSLRNLERCLKLGLLIGIFAVPFIVFVVANDMFFPFITGKNFDFRVLVELMFGGWIVLAYLNEEYRPKISAITVAVALLVVVVGVADIFGVNFDKSFWSNYERMDGYITTLHLFAYFIVLISFLKVQKRWDYLFNVMIIVSVMIGFIGVNEILEISQKGAGLNLATFATVVGKSIYPILKYLLIYSAFILIFFWKKKRLICLNYIIIGIAVIISIKGFQHILLVSKEGGMNIRLATTLGNPIYLAVYMLFHIFITLYYVFRDKIKKMSLLRSFYISALIFTLTLQTINLYFTATRGTMLGLMGGLLLTALLIALFEKERKMLRMVAIGVVCTSIIFVGLFVGFKNTSFVKESPVLNHFAVFVKESPVLNRFTTMSLTEGTAASRFRIWNMAYQGFLERPVLGWGQGNFASVFNKHYDPEMYDDEPWFDRAHNVFFDWLIVAGILGLVSYLLIFVASLYQLWKKKEDDFAVVEKSILTGLLAAYFFHNIFVFDNLISYILFFTIIAYIHFRSTHTDIFSRSLHKINHFFHTVGRKIDSSNKEDMMVPILMLVITPMVIYMVNYAPYMQNKTLIEGLREWNTSQTILNNDWRNLNEGFKKEVLMRLTPTEEKEFFGRTISVKEYNDPTFLQSLPLSQQAKIALVEMFTEESLNLFKKALNYDSFGNSETRERLLFQAISVNGQQVDQKIKNDYKDLSIKEIQKQIKETPGDAKYPLFANSLLRSFGQADEAREMIEKAREISPHKQIILFNLGSDHLEMGEYEEALEVYKEAYKSAPEYKEAAKRYGLAALYAGNEELAKEILVPIYGTHLIPDLSYINFFAKQERFSIVKDLLLQMIEKEPNQPQHHFQLVGAYIELDEKDKALETLEVIGTMFPDLKGNADYYINEINSGNI